MKLTNKQHGYISRLEDRCEILKARIRAGNPKVYYIGEWERELHAIEWAISALTALPEEMAWRECPREEWSDVREGDGWFVVGPMSAFCSVDGRYYRLKLPPLPQPTPQLKAEK